MKEDDAARLLARCGAIFRHACDLDLTVFFARHRRSLLASESLASFLGYELTQIADSLELLLRAGLIKRTQTSAHAARLYLFVPDEANQDWLQPLIDMASTRKGRAALRQAITVRAPEDIPGLETVDKAKTRTRSILVRRDPRTRGPYRRGGG